MSSRVLFGAGVLLIVLAGIVVSVRFFPASTGAATLIVQATNGGIVLTPDDTQVYVYASNNSGSLLADGTVEQPFNLTAGVYDVRVFYAASSDRQSAWIRRIALEPGGQVTRRVVFETGEIKLEATVGTADTESGQVTVYVFKPDDTDNIVTSMAAGDAVTLAAGSYDLRVVWTVGAQEKDIRWYRGVTINVGLQTRLSVPFDRGTLALQAVNAGEPLARGAVTFTVYRAGDDQEEQFDAGVAGVPLGLASGHYDVKATFAASSDKPTRWVKRVEIRDGEIAEHSVEFSSGSVMMDAELEGGESLGPYDAYIYYYQSGDHQQAVAYVPAGDLVTLEAGEYDVRAAFFRSHDQPDVWLQGLVVEAGEKLEYTASFASGKLLVRAYDANGFELIGDNVFVYVHAVNGRDSPLTVARSGEVIVLGEGVYDVRVEDTRGEHATRWLDAIELETGKLSEHVISY